MGFNLFKTIGSAVTGFVTGGPTGALVGAARGAGLVRPALQRPDSIVSVRSGAFTAGGTGFGTQRTTQYFGPSTAMTPAQAAQNGGAGCPTGFRLNKSTYVTRGGGTSRWPGGLQVHPKGSTCVRRRKVNPGNAKAATRAVRRLVSFYRLSQRVAKQLRRAASAAKIGRGGRRGQRALPAGAVTVVDTD